MVVRAYIFVCKYIMGLVIFIIFMFFLLICIFKIYFFTFLCQMTSNIFLITLKLNLPITQPFLKRFQQNWYFFEGIDLLHAASTMA